MSDILATLGIDLRFLLVATVGFVLLFLLLKKFTFGPIFNMLQARQDNIKNNLDEAEARRAEMVRLQNEYETRLAQIEDEARDKIQAAVKKHRPRVTTLLLVLKPTAMLYSSAPKKISPANATKRCHSSATRSPTWPSPVLRASCRKTSTPIATAV